jgi:tetratricopeptide (TPR) repeat protein
MRQVLLITCITVACAHPGPRAPPVEGWRELTSPHFRLRTDLPEDSARWTLEKLETLRWWLQAAWSTGGDSPGTTRAIVLDAPAELRTFTEVPGLATTTREGSLLVTAGAEAQFGDRSPGVHLLAHEIAHELIRRRMPGAPRWYHEGLAGWLQTVVPIHDRRVRFGFEAQKQLDPAPVSLTSSALLVPRKLLSLDETASRNWETASEAELTDLYLSARLWVSLLRTEEPERMRALETALAGGTAWRRAWADLRGAIDVVALQDKLWRSLQLGWPQEVRAVALLPRTIRQASSERLLAPWEVHLCLAELWSLAAQPGGGGGEAAARQMRRELEASALAAPEQPVPRVRLADLESDPEVRRARAEQLVRQFPEDPEARVFLARVLRDGGGPIEGRREAALAAVRAAPDSVDALTAYALEEMRAGNGDGALRSIARAEELEPWNPAVFLARALVLGATGRCDDAREAAQRALDVLPDDPPPARIRILIQERDRIDRACRALPHP